MTKKIRKRPPWPSSSERCNHLTVVSGVSSRPTMATSETGQVLFAGVPGGFSRGTPVFAPHTVWRFSYELK